MSFLCKECQQDEQEKRDGQQDPSWRICMRYPPLFLNAIIFLRGQAELTGLLCEGLREDRYRIVNDCSVVEREDLTRIENMELLVSAYRENSHDILNASL